MLYSDNSAIMVLGHLLNKPTILLNDKYNLEGCDFAEFHRIIFWAIKNITITGAKEIDEVAVDMFLQTNEQRYSLAKECDFMQFIVNAKEIARVDDFDYHYNIVKKYSLLRYYKKNNMDISYFYDEAKDNQDHLNEYEMEDIVKYFDKIQTQAKRNFLVNTDIEEIKAGYKMEEVVEHFTHTPMFGATTPSFYLNSISRGLLKGQLNIISLKSGGGKSTWALYNAVLLGCPRIYSEKQGCYIDNPYYTNEGVLYIDYEMSQLYETSPKLLSSLSNVPTTNILNGYYEGGQRERVDEAIKILHDSNIYMINMPNFTLSAIDTYVQDYVLNHNVGYLFFDYISEQASINSEVAVKNKVTTRGDMVLATMSSTLKDIAVKYNISVSTYTQTNAKADTAEILDASCIAGSRAVQNKADIAAVMTDIREDEIEIANDIIESKKRQGVKLLTYPNRIIHLYKVRFGQHEQGLKIWLHLDLSTGHVSDCWVTKKDNSPINMKGVELKQHGDN